jgi:hypothetical protein
MDSGYFQIFELYYKNRKQIIRKCVTVQVLRNDSNKSKFDSGGNQEESEFW